MRAESPHDSRLRMGHLLTWIVGCAVGFSAYRSITPRGILGPRPLAVVTSYSLAMGMACGAILTGCGLLTYRRWRSDISTPDRAGHWLLWLGLAGAAADVAAVATYNVLAARDPSIPATPYLAQFTPGPVGFTPALCHHAIGWDVGAAAALGFLWALRHRLGRQWLAVFLVFAIASATLAVGHITSVLLWHYGADNRRLNFFLVHVYAGCVVLGALAILAAVAGDRRSGAAGDGLHRLGVGTWLAIAAIQLSIYTIYLGRW